jgi:hypothetical protein
MNAHTGRGRRGVRRREGLLGDASSAAIRMDAMAESTTSLATVEGSLLVGMKLGEEAK